MVMKRDEFYHEIPVQVRFNDADRFGHVNNAIIQEYFDLGRASYLRSCLGNLLGDNGQHLVIVSIKTDFVQQVMPEFAMWVLTRVYKLGNKSVNMIQWIIEEGASHPLTTSESIMAGFHKPTNSGIALPQSWRDAFNRAERGTLTRDIDR